MEEKLFFDTIRNAQSKILILGTNPISSLLSLDSTAKIFAHLLNCHSKLTIEIYYESDTENFHQATNFSLGKKPARISYLETLKKRICGQSKYDSGLKEVVTEFLDLEKERNTIDDNLIIKQFNLRMPINIILIDDELYACTTLADFPTIEDYEPIKKGSNFYSRIIDYIETSISNDRAKDYLSDSGNELIWVYDKNSQPRGVYPRKSFYTTDYGRYVVWVFIFNRKGELLLQRRSMATKDNRGLWDKSIGGHVDLCDSSTAITAKRELIEETYMPDAEFTDYVKADIGDIIDFGELNFNKRPERYLKKELVKLGRADWAMFRATTNSGEPLKIQRVSERIINVSEEKSVIKKTIFHADVYLMMAPCGQFESVNQLQRDLPSGHLAATSERKLLTIDELINWIHDVEQAGQEKSIFTDDMLHINTVHIDILEQFSEFVKFLNREG